MFGRYRLSIVAVVGLAIVIAGVNVAVVFRAFDTEPKALAYSMPPSCDPLAAPARRTDQQPNQASKSNSKSGQSQIAKPLAPAEQQREGSQQEAEQADCEKRHTAYSDREDLDAQRRMADGTAQLVHWTRTSYFSAVVVGVLDTLLLFATLAVALWATREAKRAADAADTSAALIKETAKTQLRAYIVIDCEQIESWNPHVVAVKANVHNTGQTPAKHLTIKYAVRLFDKLPPRDFTDEADEIIDADMSIGAGKERKVTFGSPALGSSHEAAAARKVLVAFGTATYQDVFGESHTTKFCHTYREPYLGEKRGRYYQYGNGSD